MHLAPYIETLLEERNFVILPGFGAFEPGAYLGISINENGELLPPKRAVSFNPHLSNDDSVLATVIASKELLEIDDAKAKLKALVFEWKSTLNKEGSLVIEGLGRFEKANGVIQLITEASELKLGSFGLPAVAPPSKKEETINDVAQPIQKEGEQSKVERPKEHKPSKKAEEKPEVVEETTSAPSFAYQLAIVLAVIAVISVGYFFYSQLKGVDLSNLI
jgi:nucleoid DNA-binding protein